MPVKSILASWTFWFNVISAAYVAADQAGLIKAIPPPWDILAIALGNILLRFKTDSPVALFAPKP